MEQYVKCQHCGGVLTEKDRFCPSCGAPNAGIVEFSKQETEHRRTQEDRMSQAELLKAEAYKQSAENAAKTEKTFKTGCLIAIIPFVLIMILSVLLAYRKSTADMYAESQRAIQESMAIESSVAEEETPVVAKNGDWCEKPLYRFRATKTLTYEYKSDHHLMWGSTTELADDEERIVIFIEVENTGSKPYDDDEDIWCVNDDGSDAEVNSYAGHITSDELIKAPEEDALSNRYTGGTIQPGVKKGGWILVVANTSSPHITLYHGPYAAVVIENPVYTDN